MARVQGFFVVLLSALVGCDGSSAAPFDGGSELGPDATAEGVQTQDGAAAQDDGAAARDASDTSDAAASDDSTPLGACRSYFHAQCDRYRACRLSVPSSCTHFDACPDLLFAPGSNWTVEKARACAPEWSKVSCEDLALERRPGCDTTPGNFEIGHSCIGRMQCQSLSCNSTALYSDDCGTCLKVVALGDACDFNTTDCPRGQGCEEGRCVERPWVPMTDSRLTAGEACGADLSCQAGLGCALEGDAGVGTCQPLPGVGATCLASNTGSRLCAPGAICDAPPADKCVALPKAGEPCRQLRCDAQSYCVSVLTGLPSPGDMCVARRSAGEPCDRERFLSRDQGRRAMCGDGLECLHRADLTATTVCATPRDLGDSCDDARQLCVYGTHCEAGKCLANAESTLYGLLCKGQ